MFLCLFMAVKLPLLFVSDSLDRIQLRRFLRWIPTEEDTRHRTDHETEQHAPWLDVDGEVGDHIDHHRSPNAKEHTDQTSCHADQDRLNQELRQDVDAFRTNTHTQTDLTGTLRHADIHDIHDTDTADQQ